MAYLLPGTVLESFQRFYIIILKEKLIIFTKLITMLTWWPPLTVLESFHRFEIIQKEKIVIKLQLQWQITLSEDLRDQVDNSKDEVYLYMTISLSNWIDPNFGSKLTPYFNWKSSNLEMDKPIIHIDNPKLLVRDNNTNQTKLIWQ